MLKIYKSGFGGFFFAKQKDDWWTLHSQPTDIGTYRLCASSLGCEEERSAFDKAVEVSSADEVYFDKIAREDNNFEKIKSFLQRFFDVDDAEMAKTFGYCPDIVQLTKEIVDESGYKERVDDWTFGKIFRDVKRLVGVWNQDKDRVKAYAKNRGIVQENVFREDVMVDVRCRDHHKRDLLRDFHAYWKDSRLGRIVDRACEKYPEENDFDKRYAYVKDKIVPKRSKK